MTCSVSVALILMLSVHIGRAIHDDLIDPYHIADQFTVDCGTKDAKIMDILFRGTAHGMYARVNHRCMAVELGPAHLGIEDALSNAYCAVHKASGLEVYSLSVIIQKGPVRMYDDPYYLVTCSYELMGSKTTDDQETLDSDLPQKPQIVQALDETALSSVTLGIRDEHDQDVHTVSLGDYIQLVAFMEPVAGEVSFRVWNCRALTNDSGTLMEHHILYQGCGDDRLIKVNRGFLTSKMTQDDGSEVRVARSVFFRAFTFLSQPALQFECDYIISRDASADGTREGETVQLYRSPTVRARSCIFISPDGTSVTPLLVSTSMLLVAPPSS